MNKKYKYPEYMKSRAEELEQMQPLLQSILEDKETIKRFKANPNYLFECQQVKDWESGLNPWWAGCLSLEIQASKEYQEA